MDKFWESQHIDKNSYWLTGSSLKSIENWHKLNFSSYRNKKILIGK